MRILVTGGTGFVGGWSAVALQRGGHELRFLVRDPQRLEPVAALGVDTSDHVTGGITDHDAVREALDGCDAVVHCAAMVATDPRHDAEVQATNLAGAEAVLGTAAEKGLDPIVHTSSITSLFAPGLEVFDPDLGTGTAGDAYGVSKVAVDEYARALQHEGVPVVITYPGMVVGPGVGNRFGEVVGGFETVLRGRIVPGSDAGWVVIDVRDLAEVNAALMTPGLGPRRYMVGGTYLDVSEIAQAFADATGNWMVRLPVPGWGLRAMGSLIDRFIHPLGVTSPLTRAAMDYYTQMPPSDDSAVHAELGVEYRDMADTFTDCIASMYANGRITAGQAGRAASAGQ